MRYTLKLLLLLITPAISQDSPKCNFDYYTIGKVNMGELNFVLIYQLNFFCQEEFESGAMIEASQTQLYNRHYLRVTLKSVTSFRAFMLKALSDSMAPEEGSVLDNANWPV